MNNFLPLKGNCPVCNGARKDCRQSKQTGLVFCRDSEANPPDYIFRDLDKLGFGIWAEKATVEAAFQQQRQLERQRQLDAEHHQRSQYLQEAIAEQRLTDYLEGLEKSGFLGEGTQLFFLNLAQHLQEAAQ